MNIDNMQNNKPWESSIDENEITSNKLISAFGINEESFQMLKPVFNQNKNIKNISHM